MKKAKKPGIGTCIVLSVLFGSIATGMMHEDPHGTLRERRREQGERVAEVSRMRTRSCEQINGGGDPTPIPTREEIHPTLSESRRFRLHFARFFLGA